MSTSKLCISAVHILFQNQINERAQQLLLFSEILMHQTHLYTDTPSDMNVLAPPGYIFGIYRDQVNERGHQLKLLSEIKYSQPHIIKHILNP